MESNSKGASFRQFLNEDNCTSIFQIPSQLVKSYGDVLPSEATLSIDKSGKGWKVLIEKFKDQYFFTDGWKEFAEQVGLKSRKFIVFKSVGCMQSNTGTKEERRKISDDASDLRNSTLHVNCENKDFGVGESLSFSKVLKKSDVYRVNIPNKFVTGTGIAKGEEIKLKDSEGREWPIRLAERGCAMCLGEGWYDFLIGNKVVVGGTVTFLSLSKYMIETRIVEEGTNKQVLFSFVQKKGNGFELTFKSDKAGGHAKVSQNSRLKASREKEGSSEEENDFGLSKKWEFSKELKKYDAYTLDIPKHFSTVIGEATNMEIKLMDPEGRKWPVQVKYMKHSFYRMTTGWKDFLLGNKVCVGSMILLESIPSCDDVIKARVINNENKENELFIKRAR